MPKMSPFCAWKRKGSTDFDFEVVTLIYDLEILHNEIFLKNTLYKYALTLEHIGLNGYCD